MRPTIMMALEFFGIPRRLTGFHAWLLQHSFAFPVRVQTRFRTWKYLLRVFSWTLNGFLADLPQKPRTWLKAPTVNRTESDYDYLQNSRIYFNLSSNSRSSTSKIGLIRHTQLWRFFWESKLYFIDVETWTKSNESSQELSGGLKLHRFLFIIVPHVGLQKLVESS